VATHYVPVASLDDERLFLLRGNERRLASRPERRDETGAGHFVAEGDLVVERALDAGCEPVVALADADDVERLEGLRDLLDRLDIDVFVGGDAVRRAVLGLGVAMPVVAAFRRPPRASSTALLARASRLVVIEGIDNPANVGAVVRNAAGLGWDAILLDGASADPLARRALRVSMGAALRVPFARSDDLVVELRAAIGIETFALTPSADATPLDEVRPLGRRAVLVGSERGGLTSGLLELADHRVRIPMAPGVDSLNAGAATAIACHVLRR
jgi:tRNA G18 (ribose-2'-O)-methylase SpoU